MCVLPLLCACCWSVMCSDHFSVDFNWHSSTSIHIHLNCNLSITAGPLKCIHPKYNRFGGREWHEKRVQGHMRSRMYTRRGVCICISAIDGYSKCSWPLKNDCESCLTELLDQKFVWRNVVLLLVYSMVFNIQEPCHVTYLYVFTGHYTTPLSATTRMRKIET